MFISIVACRSPNKYFKQIGQFKLSSPFKKTLIAATLRRLHLKLVLTARCMKCQIWQRFTGGTHMPNISCLKSTAYCVPVWYVHNPNGHQNNKYPTHAMSTGESSTSTQSSAKNVAHLAAELEINQQPVCLVVLGMAGSGKTTFVKKLLQFSDMKNLRPYAVNLDPACKEVPFHANIGMLLSIITAIKCSWLF